MCDCVYACLFVTVQSCTYASMSVCVCLRACMCVCVSMFGRQCAFVGRLLCHRSYQLTFCMFTKHSVASVGIEYKSISFVVLYCEHTLISPRGYMCHMMLVGEGMMLT